MEQSSMTALLPSIITRSDLNASDIQRTRERQEKEGKRWARRRDNSRFIGNGHIVKPTSGDFQLTWLQPRSTFPKPLPPYIPRKASAPSAATPRRDPISANAGRYSLSLKGVRRELRRSRSRAEQLVLDIEQELTEWLTSTGVIISPEIQANVGPQDITGKEIGFSSCIKEISRQPTELIWRIDQDFPRFLLHCVARFYNVVSYSKTATNNVRLTHLLRPNVTRPDFTASIPLHTPPTSDIESISILADTEDSDLDIVSSLDPLLEEADNEASDDIVERHSDGISMARGRTRSRVSSREREYEASESSLARDERDSMSLSVESLSIENSDKDWECMQDDHCFVPSSSPPHSIRRANVVGGRSQVAMTLTTRSHLQFWRYVFE